MKPISGQQNGNNNYTNTENSDQKPASERETLERDQTTTEDLGQLQVGAAAAASADEQTSSHRIRLEANLDECLVASIASDRQALKSVSPITKGDHRIRVTLSAPRNSTDIRVEPILLNSGASSPLHRRKSTATLISCTSSIGSQLNSAHLSQQPATPSQSGTLSGRARDERHLELRKIVSECKKQAQESQKPEPQINRKELDLQDRSPAKRPQPASQLATQNPKQLAIYINGKIRSNSIFCRSSSSTSFNSIFNRFQLSSGRSDQEPRVGINDKQSPLRLCKKSKSRCELAQKSTPFLPPARGHKLLFGLRSGARKLLRGYLSASADSRGAISKEREECQANLQSGESDNKEKTQNSSYKLNPSSMFLKKAMRYYRLWIYCTNITILLGALIFISSTLYVSSDYRVKLLVSSSSQIAPSVDWQVSLTEPCVLIAYLVVLIQAGILQAIGCFGAIRMKERWIQTFWYLILALTVFDVVFLVYWLNRYDLIVRSLRQHMTSKLNQHYGPASSVPVEDLLRSGSLEAKLDKTLTEIIDKIQADSKCCGISSPLDYRRSRWRQWKLEELSNKLNWTDPKLRDILRRVPLVPATCCRPSSLEPLSRPVILDDSQIDRPARVPAWAPSMVVENIQQGHIAPPAQDPPEGVETLAEATISEMMDGRWNAARYWDYELDDNTSPGRRRLLAKQQHYNRPRRWVLESSVDPQQRVLTRLLLIDDAAQPTQSELNLFELRRLVFQRDAANSTPAWTREQFEPSNRMQLTFDQYKTIETYLLKEARFLEVNSDQETSLFQTNISGPLRHRRAFSGSDNNLDSVEADNETERLKQELAETLKSDPEISCAARSYFDQANIHTQGCHPAVKGWLDFSARILFVTGFCVLTVLKFCSVVLLRLEIREMIHKIRVLKGMATEYNALHDLEAYLPRPSVCAQAAELTASGVTAALGSGVPGNNPASASTSAYRLGGSFSEAVVAATAAAQIDVPTGTVAGLGLASSGRTVSMKTVQARSTMLTPNLYPRSSSASSAHLYGGSWLGPKQQLLTDQTQISNVLSRRHTAISVCPAAALAAAAAADHLAAYRHAIYVTNPASSGHSSLSQTGPKGLGRHRHSAHAVHVGSLGAGQERTATTNSPRLLGESHAGRVEHQSSGDSNMSGPGWRTQRLSTGSHQLLSLVYPFKRQSSRGAQSAANFSFDVTPSLTVESRRSIH